MSQPPLSLYYIQNRGFCGNCLIWWRFDRCGYTTNLDEAIKLPEYEARQLCLSRPEQDKPWLVSEIDAIACRHVDSESMRAALTARGSREGF